MQMTAAQMDDMASMMARVFQEQYVESMARLRLFGAREGFCDMEGDGPEEGLEGEWPCLESNVYVMNLLANAAAEAARTNIPTEALMERLGRYLLTIKPQEDAARARTDETESMISERIKILTLEQEIIKGAPPQSS